MKPALLVAAWLLLHPSAGVADRARYKAIATAIVDESGRAPLRAGTEASSWLLSAIAQHEGNMREDVRRCVVTGDHGKAFSLFQLHEEAFGSFSEAQVCSDDRVAARLALATLREGERICDGDLRCAVRLYASGRKTETKAAREIWRLWRRLSFSPLPRRGAHDHLLLGYRGRDLRRRCLRCKDGEAARSRSVGKPSRRWRVRTVGRRQDRTARAWRGRSHLVLVLRQASSSCLHRATRAKEIPSPTTA